MVECNELRIPEVLDTLREAPTRPDLWPAALQKLANAFNAGGWVLKRAQPSSFAPIYSPSLDIAFEHAMREGWVDKDIRLARCLSAFAQGGDIVTETMIFSPLELNHFPYNAEFINRFNLRSFVAMSLAGEGPSSIILELQRLGKSDTFSEREIESLRRLIPHLREVSNLALRFARAHHNALLTAFSTFDCGVVLLDWKGRAVRLGPDADAIMGPALNVRDSFLRARDPDSDTFLQKLIHSVIAQETLQVASSFGVVAIARHRAPPLLVKAVQLPPTGADRFLARAALMLIDEATRRTPQIPNLRQIFGLTISEAQVALALAEGHDIDEIAEMRRVSPGTLRAQLRSIFAKTDTRRQAELVGLLLRYSCLIR